MFSIIQYTKKHLFVTLYLRLCLHLSNFSVIFSGLLASLLVRHPETGELYVNCDPQLIQLIRETECMMKMKLHIPETARLLYLRRATIRSVADNLKVRKQLF